MLQIEELLKEARMKKKQEKNLTQTVENLKDILLNMSAGKEHKVYIAISMHGNCPRIRDFLRFGCHISEISSEGEKIHPKTSVSDVFSNGLYLL